MLLLFFYQITEGAEMNKKNILNQNHCYFKDFLCLCKKKFWKIFELRFEICVV